MQYETTRGLKSLHGIKSKPKPYTEDQLIDAEKVVSAAIVRYRVDYGYITCKMMADTVPLLCIRQAVQRRMRMKRTSLHTGDNGYLMQNMYGVWRGI